MLKRILILCCVIISGTSYAQIAAQKQLPIEQVPSNFYGSVEMRHHVNTYFDEEGYRGKQEPSTHFRFQAGVQLYNSNLDLYGTIGVYKKPQTQQIIQRRPQIALDMHLLRTPTFQLLQYNIIQVPFSNEEQEIESEKVVTDATDAGTVYTTGLAPTVSHITMAGDSMFKFKFGLDGWTKMYTRKKYIEDAPYVEGGQREDGYGFVDSKGEPIEDTANHYDLLSLVGIEMQPGFSNNLLVEATVNYTRRFEPIYSMDEAKNIDYKYGVEDRSYYQIRGKFKLTESLTLINDFYHFHGGFFESKRDGDNRRFRNIARITCAL